MLSSFPGFRPRSHLVFHVRWYRRKRAAEAAMMPAIFVCGRKGNSVHDRVEVTNLLRAWSNGDHSALDRLAERVYGELHLMARRFMKNERQENTLQATALVNEVYIRLVDVGNVEWRQRAQFFAMAAQMMRRILVDAARAKHARKRGSGA